MKMSGISQSELILNSMSDALIKEMKKEFYIKMLKIHDVFRIHFSENFLIDLSTVMEEQNLAYEEVLYEQDECC